MVLRKAHILILLLCTCFGTAQEFDLEVEPAFDELLSVADTDGDRKITVEDEQDAFFWLGNIHGDSVKLQSAYHLSNLLQELALANSNGRDSVKISLDKIMELPATRISRRIQEIFWDDLTRTIDRKGILEILDDQKTAGRMHRIYIPAEDSAGIAYYTDLQKELKNFEAVVLPREITPEFVRSINDKPGILALALKDAEGVPFVVPGGRFNEMYGWDSYFEAIGLLIDDRIDLATAMVDNFVYQINYYGKVLNANRSYYLTRSQPPFMSSFVREVYESMEDKDIAWLKISLQAAIKEYQQVWMEPGKRLTDNGLNRYLAEGIRIPPETEEGHFRNVLESYARKHKMPVEEFREEYQEGIVQDSSLDQYFLHDRTLRESGHDTSWRLENRAAHLNTVDLNSLLHKYEKDFAYLTETYFEGQFCTESGTCYTANDWSEKANRRKELIDHYLWNPEKGSFYDYNFVRGEQTGYISATNFYPLWSETASRAQAQAMVQNLMTDLKTTGGILSSAKSSVEKEARQDVERQWDYPYGWAPHQMLLWKGLLNYGYEEQAQELIYRWLWMITKNAVDYNGTIPEKFDVVNATHKVYAEYGNVGTEFDYITTSGFGWMNASYQLGLELLKPEYLSMLNSLVAPDEIF